MPAPKHLGTHQNALFRKVDASDLNLNEHNERDYNAADDRMDRLRQSLKSEGVLQPLAIYEDGVVHDGNRRLFSVRLLIESGEWTHGPLPAIIVPRPENEQEGVIARLNTNEAEQFSPIEQGRAFAKLRAADMNNTQIAARTPFTSMHIGNMLTLHDATEETKEIVRAGQMSATLAVEVMRKHGEGVVQEAVTIALGQGKERATQRHVDAVMWERAKPIKTVEESLASVGMGSAPEASAPVETPPWDVETDAEAEVETEVEIEAEPETDVTVLSDAVPEGPKVESEEEVIPNAVAQAPKPVVTPKVAVQMVAPTVQALLQALKSGTKAEKLEALAEAEDDLEAFLRIARTLGIVKAD
jgi:hypothetical protein